MFVCGKVTVFVFYLLQIVLYYVIVYSVHVCASPRFACFCRMPWFPFSYWKSKKDGVNAVLLGPPASGKGTQVNIF